MARFPDPYGTGQPPPGQYGNQQPYGHSQQGQSGQPYGRGQQGPYQQPYGHGQQPGPYGGQVLDYGQASEQAAVASFFNAVYGWMAAGLALTAVVAWVVSNNVAWMREIFRPGVIITLLLVELGLVFVISAAVEKLTAPVATALFMLYAAINGLTLAAIFIVYTGASVAGTFVATAGTFGAMSLYGMLTRRDLTRLGSLLFMALIGLIIASVVNIFVASSALYWAITYLGILIFVGLTAYDTQRLKQIAYATAHDPRMAARYAINGALILYLDFINLFLLLLRLLGNRR